MNWAMPSGPRRVDLELTDDAPFRIEDTSDYTIPAYAEGGGRPHLRLKIENDLIEEAQGSARVLNVLADARPATLF